MYESQAYSAPFRWRLILGVVEEKLSSLQHLLLQYTTPRTHYLIKHEALSLGKIHQTLRYVR